MKKIYLLTILALSTITRFATAQQQSVLNPSDPIVIYNKNSPPTQPPYGKIGKWVKTTRLSWNTTMF
ncbi:MAG TPA: hypothetical protein VNE41_05180, partial [Chitinophagaceae bacterium]|nr:hypothetical protein [Chitinophagaceae bacterium]